MVLFVVLFIFVDNLQTLEMFSNFDVNKRSSATLKLSFALICILKISSPNVYVI